MKKAIYVLILSLLWLLAMGSSWANTTSQASMFHDMRVNSTKSFVALINPEDPDIVRLAKQFKSYEDAYRFVSDEIEFVPHAPSGRVHGTLHYKAGSCIGKAVLLCSLYRAMGMPSEDIRIVVGLVAVAGGVTDHVWIDMEYNGKCWQQDPSGMLARFGFYDFPGTRYVDRFVVKENFCFNDRYLAIVSQMNRIRNSKMH